MSRILLPVCLLLGLLPLQSGPPTLAGELRIMAGPIAQNITDHTAIIFWLTSRDALMRLNYGLTEANLTQTATLESVGSGQDSNREHRALLKNLQPD